jgi:hypothetical protein
MSGPAEGYCHFYQSITRRAKKQHRCEACGLTIQYGERYQYVSYLYEGLFETVKRCGRCETIFRHLQTLIDTDQVVMERLDCGLDYEEEWEAPPPVELQAAIFATSDEAAALLEARP